MTDDLTTGADFGRATASWFGLDVDKVSDVQLQTDLNEPLLVTVTILLGPEDVTGIGKRMKEMAAGSNGIVEAVAPNVDPAFALDPRCKRAMQLAGATAVPRTCPVCTIGPCKFQVPVPDPKGE